MPLPGADTTSSVHQHKRTLHARTPRVSRPPHEARYGFHGRHSAHRPARESRTASRATHEPPPSAHPAESRCVAPVRPRACDSALEELAMPTTTRRRPHPRPRTRGRLAPEARTRARQGARPKAKAALAGTLANADIATV